MENFIALSLIYKGGFLFCLEHSAWLVSNGFQGLYGTEVSWLLNISPELSVYHHLAQLDIIDVTLSHTGLAFSPQFFLEPLQTKI